MSIKHKYDKDKAKSLVEKANNIMVLSGAGLSTEAGIPDFRSKNGLYSHNFHGYPPEKVLSHSFYNENIDLFWDYMKSKLNYSDVKPDSSYKLLAKLEEQGKIKAIVTQNIDSLHFEAGSKNVIEVHGTLKKCYCEDCGNEYSYDELITGEVDYKCNCKGHIRPDVVLFDEDVPKIYDAVMATEGCDLLLVLGTSLVVYPVASIPRIFLEKNLPVVIINRDETPYHGVGNVTEVNDSLGSTLKYIFQDTIKDI